MFTVAQRPDLWDSMRRSRVTRGSNPNKDSANDNELGMGSQEQSEFTRAALQRMPVPSAAPGGAVGDAPSIPNGSSNRAQMELKWSPVELKWSPMELKWS